MKRHIDFAFWYRAILVTGIFALILAGCGGKKSSTNTESSGFDDFSTLNQTQDPYAGLPSNLFSGSTTADPLPASSSTTSTTALPSSSEQLCLANDNALFSGLGNLGSTGQSNQFPSYYGTTTNMPTACWAGNSGGVDPAIFWKMGAAMMGNLDQCLTTLLSYQPRNDAEAYDLSIVAEMAAFRCIRADLRRRMGMFGPQHTQQQQFNDGQFYWVIQELSQMR